MPASAALSQRHSGRIPLANGQAHRGLQRQASGSLRREAQGATQGSVKAASETATVGGRGRGGRGPEHEHETLLARIPAGTRGSHSGRRGHHSRSRRHDRHGHREVKHDHHQWWGQTRWSLETFIREALLLQVRPLFNSKGHHYFKHSKATQLHTHKSTQQTKSTKTQKIQNIVRENKKIRK